MNSVDVEMMEAQMSKNKLARMAISGGDFRKAGKRSMGEFSTANLSNLLEDDIKDLQSKGTDIENIRIDEEEFDAIMDRKRLFSNGDDAPKPEGKMYDMVDAHRGDTLLGSVNA